MIHNVNSSDGTMRSPGARRLRPRWSRSMVPLLLALVLALVPSAGRAQSAAAPEKPAASPKADAAAAPVEVRANDKLALEQQRVGDRYKRLEEVLLRMAELSAATDPRRAALLRKAVAQSKERVIAVQFETLVELLKKDELARAIENQAGVQQDLQALLDLLLSENRAKRLESEKARIREYLKRLSAIINQQKGIQGQTGGGGEPKQLAGDQARLADKAGGLAKDIQTNEEGPDKGKKPESGPPKKAGEQGSPSGGKPPKDQAKGRQGGQGQGPPQAGGADQDKSQAPASQDHPARKRLEAAQKRMREAEEKLKQAQRKGAVEKQEEAIRELEQARMALEEILRQLREEEIQRMLTTLEARIAKMLGMQREVLDGTVRLDKVPQAERTHEHEIQAGRLSSKEAEIDLEADKALMLLREDGTAMALPEALGQLRHDIRQVVERLSAAKVDKITQGIEEDIIAALDEMAQALKKALKDREKNKPRSSRRPGEPQEPPLVDALAELKMIRTLQVRINLRTERYSKLIQGEQAEKADLIEALKRLAEREERIFRITRDLHLGKNR